MFGYPAAFVGGNMATGLFAERWVVRLPDAEIEGAKAAGADRSSRCPGKPMKAFVVIPAADVADDAAIRGWVERGLAHAGSMPAEEVRRPLLQLSREVGRDRLVRGVDDDHGIVDRVDVLVRPVVAVVDLGQRLARERDRRRRHAVGAGRQERLEDRRPELRDVRLRQAERDDRDVLDRARLVVGLGDLELLERRAEGADAGRERARARILAEDLDALALITVSGIDGGGDAVEVVSRTDVGRSASSSGANGDADGSTPPTSSEPIGPPLADGSSVAAAPALPAAFSSPIAAATAAVIAASSDGLAVPLSAT